MIRLNCVCGLLCRLWSANWPQWVLSGGDSKAQAQMLSLLTKTITLSFMSWSLFLPRVCHPQKHHMHMHMHSQSLTCGMKGTCYLRLFTIRHVWGAKMWNGKWYSVTYLGFLCVKQPRYSYSHRSSGHTKGNLLLLSSGNASKWYSLSWG